MELCDVLIIGAGPGGLAAAQSAKKNGANRVIVLDRSMRAGGILNQCVHDGFGLVRYGASISGPEYAANAEAEALSAGAELHCGMQVVSMDADRHVIAQGREGMKEYQAGSIVLATGCRERTRGAISVPGTRPAGIFTAGVLQNLVNMSNIMCGKRIVILGSGDIGLIMARRMTLEGAKVEAVLEVMPNPGGLARNISQCLYDFDIPLYVSHTVSNIIGKKKLEAVEVSQVDENMQVIQGTSRIIECDALVLSVGLIPENEAARGAGISLDVRTNGAVTDDHLMTDIPGVFACGNCRKVMDLADYVSEQGTLAGENAAHFIRGEEMICWKGDQTTGLLKGFPTPGSVTCPICPNGCQVTANADDTFSGNRCKRGEKFARQEAKQPRRTLTTTLKVIGAAQPLISVRSTGTFPKEYLPEAMRILKTITVSAPVRRGDVLYTFNMEDDRIDMIAGSDCL